MVPGVDARPARGRNPVRWGSRCQEESDEDDKLDHAQGGGPELDGQAEGPQGKLQPGGFGFERVSPNKIMRSISQLTMRCSHLTGKAQDEIRQDIAAGYDRMLDSFINDASARKIRKQLEDDVSSIPEGSRRRSVAEQTDAGLVMTKYMENLDIAAAPEEPSQTIDTR